MGCFCPGSLVILLSDFRFLDADCRGQLVELTRHNDVVMIHTYDPFERMLPEPGYYRVTDGSSSIDIDTSSSSARAQYSEPYTTLGFGDVTANTWLGEIIIISEVIIGYFTLGLLLSILANTIARRS